jgi:hypothetical protein
MNGRRSTSAEALRAAIEGSLCAANVPPAQSLKRHLRRQMAENAMSNQNPARDAASATARGGCTSASARGQPARSRDAAPRRAVAARAAPRRCCDLVQNKE